MISIEILIGSALVIPYFSFYTRSERNLSEDYLQKIIGKPNVTKDKFWYIDKSFFDRSGWEELIELNNYDNNKKKQ